MGPILPSPVIRFAPCRATPVRAQPLRKGGRMVSACLEATGLYSLEVALALHRHRRTPVMVVNPKASKTGNKYLRRALYSLRSLDD